MERSKNRAGESQERTTWLRIVAFNGLGSACAEYLKRGDPVFVEGRLQIREYEDKDRNARTSVEVVASKVRFLGGGKSGDDEKRPHQVNRERAPHHARRPRLKLTKVGRTCPSDPTGSGACSRSHLRRRSDNNL